MRHVHYVDSGTKFPVQPGNEGPPDKIGEIAQSTCGLLSNVPLSLAHDALAPSPTSLSSASPPGFSLLGGKSLGDHVATDVSRWADWSSRLNMLRNDGLHVATVETVGFVHTPTKIGLKINPFDLSGETPRMQPVSRLQMRCPLPLGEPFTGPLPDVVGPVTLRWGQLRVSVRFQCCLAADED